MSKGEPVRREVEPVLRRRLGVFRVVVLQGVGAHNSVVGADQGLRAPSWDLMCRILYRFRRVAGTAGGA